MQKLKKLICMLLCVTFVLSCIPVVHADDGDRTYCPYGHTSHVGIDCDAEMITWSKWTETTSLPTSGSYYLADDVTISSACSPSDLNLDLSGRSITRTLTSSSTGSACNVFSVVSGKSFLLTDVTGQENGIVSVSFSAGQSVANSTLGKLVKIGKDATMKMYGGILDGSNIYGNTKNNVSNGTLNVEECDSGTTSFYMYGGEIRGFHNYNEADGTKTYYNGSAIIARSSTKLEIRGGKVVGGTCKYGACINSSTNDTKLLGGEYKAGTANVAGACVYVAGTKATIGDVIMDGGVYIYSNAANLTLTGAPQISDTCALGYGIGIGASADNTINAKDLNANARINIKNNRTDPTAAAVLTVDEDLSQCFTFYDKNFDSNYVGAYDAEKGTISMRYFVAAGNTPCECSACNGTVPTWGVWDGVANSGHYYLAEDTALSETFVPHAEQTLVLNLNGHTLSKGNAGSMFRLQNQANLVILDGSPNATGEMVGYSAAGVDGSLILTDSDNASAEIYGGTFSVSNPETKAGNGALLCANAGTINAAGGKFQAGTAEQGDTLYAATGSKLVIKGNAHFDGGIEIAAGVDASISETPVVRKLKDGSAYAIKTASRLKVGTMATGARVFISNATECVLASEFTDTNAFDASFYFSADGENMRIKVVDETIKIVPILIDEDVIQARRDQAEAYMRQNANLLWRATEDISYCFSTSTNDPAAAPDSRMIHIKAGRVYRGIPYSYSATTISSFLDYASEPDENGIYDISGLTALTMSGASNSTRMGNDCSSSFATAWSQFGASIYATTSSGYVPRYGMIPIGDYIPLESYTTGTAEVIALNSAETMYESYALLQKADGLARWKSANNHTMMVTSVHVVRNADNSINPTSSYVRVLEQTSTNVTKERTATIDGIGTVYIICGVDTKYTFEKLLTDTYIPFTCMELIDASPVDKAEVKDDPAIETPSADNLFEGTITSNKFIDCVTITVKDEEGNVVQKAAQNAYRSKPRQFIMSEFITGQPRSWSRGIVDLDTLPAGQYECDVVCRLTTGQEITVREFDINLSGAVLNTATGVSYTNIDTALALATEGHTLQLLQDIAQDVQITKNITLDLNGHSIVGNLSTGDGVTAALKDAQTDDYTVEDDAGYGKITGTVSGVEAQKGYMMITENGEVSFHRLNLDPVTVCVRPSVAGIYYSSQFGGDEVIKRNIVAYGSALGAGIAPNFADKTYTRFTADTWQTGADSEGNSKNIQNGTILQNIMTANDQSGAETKVYSQAYVELSDGTKVLGKLVCCSLRDMIEGTDKLAGVNQIWSSLKPVQQEAMLNMYRAYSHVMSTWNIPNIISAAQ